MSNEESWRVVVRGEGAVASWAPRMAERIPDLLGVLPGRLTLTMTEESAPLAVFPFRSAPVAVLTTDPVPGGPDRLFATLEGLGALSAYAVETAWPVRYERDWPDGEPTPSPILLTLLRRLRTVSDEDYVRRWHDGHTPLSLQIHPLWHYERNVILRALTEESAPCDGIVAEACATRADLLDPRRFYGGTFAMLPNMIRVATDVLGFLDLGRTEVYFATERILRS